jgi:hypothetical protein
VIALTSEALATVIGAAGAYDNGPGPTFKWWTNILDKGGSAASDMADKGATYGGIIGFGAAAAGGVTLPAAGLAALAGSAKGYVIGLGVGFVGGAGAEAIRTWDSRPWKK